MAASMVERIDQPWLHEPSLQTLLSLLNSDGGQARIAGGAVRNALLGQPIADIDVATTLVPRDVTLRLKAAGHKSVPTGIEHGTVTAVVDGHAYEVTTLREDMETDGRRAQVRYGTDWEKDARRRDLTINALYLDADGTIFDPLDGIGDVRSQTVRFIDDAETRIREDYLRILRFFRFFAWYGRFRPDADGLRACARLKLGMQNLSAERIWHEITRIFAAPDPARAVLWMRQTSVLSMVLPESEKWGIDALPPLVLMGREQQWPDDPLLRLMAVLPPEHLKLKQLGDRLKIPNRVRDRFDKWAATPEPSSAISEVEFRIWAYPFDPVAVADRIMLAAARGDKNSRKFLRQLKWLGRWQRPQFPLKGKDLIEQGMEPGPAVSDRLKRLENRWVESGFELSRDALLEMTNQL